MVEDPVNRSGNETILDLLNSRESVITTIFLITKIIYSSTKKVVAPEDRETGRDEVNRTEGKMEPVSVDPSVRSGTVTIIVVGRYQS